jgi:hypothetical protein
VDFFYHQDDWGSNDGMSKNKAEYWLTVWVHITKATLVITTDPLEAWNQIKHCEYTVKFLGGGRNKPSENHGVLTPALGRAPVGGDSWEPRYTRLHS